MARNGLARGEAGLEVYMMCEIPSNVVLAEQFAARFDGFSIGSNDLTQLVLGVDRDSGDLPARFDERDEAVKHKIARASCRERVCQYVESSGVAVSSKKKKSKTQTTTKI